MLFNWKIIVFAIDLKPHWSLNNIFGSMKKSLTITSAPERNHKNPTVLPVLWRSSEHEKWASWGPRSYFLSLLFRCTMLQTHFPSFPRLLFCQLFGFLITFLVSFIELFFSLHWSTANFSVSINYYSYRVSLSWGFAVTQHDISRGRTFHSLEMPHSTINNSFFRAFTTKPITTNHLTNRTE